MTDQTQMQQVADRLELHELYGRYCFGLDYQRDEELLDCFTPDGVFSLSDRGDFEGHEGIQKILDASAATRNRHHIMNIVVQELDGDRARVKAYFILLHYEDARIISWGHYDDDAVRCDDGRWRWTMKRVNFEWRSEDYAARSEGQQASDLTRAT